MESVSDTDQSYLFGMIGPETKIKSIFNPTADQRKLLRRIFFNLMKSKKNAIAKHEKKQINNTQNLDIIETFIRTI